MIANFIVLALVLYSLQLAKVSTDSTNSSSHKKNVGFPLNETNKSDSNQSLENIMKKPTDIVSDLMPHCVIRGKFAVKGDCRNFVVCHGSGMQAKHRRCKMSYKFDHIRRTCVKPEQAYCDLCKEGDIIPNPLDRSGFLNCINSVYRPIPCPYETYFISKSQGCQVLQNVKNITAINVTLPPDYDNYDESGWSIEIGIRHIFQHLLNSTDAKDEETTEDNQTLPP